MSDYDVIVVGARCAGAPTAMLLARRGYRVLLVDRATFPSDTVSTLVLQPHGVARLASWGLLDALTGTGCPALHTYVFDLGSVTIAGSPGTTDYPVAYAPRRTVLDALLVEAAGAAGVEVREQFSVDELVVTDGRVTGVRGRGRDGQSVTEGGRVVVGADGVRSTVARAVAAPSYHDKPPLLCGYYAYWSELPTYGRWETFLRPDRGFAAAETHDDLTVLIACWPYAEFRTSKTDLEGHYLGCFDLAPEFAERLRGARRETRIVGAVVPNFLRRPYGPGWALVGDAGYSRDFVTAQGIADAFRDADLCAAALDSALSDQQPYAEAMRVYQDARDAQVLPMYEMTLDVATLEPPSPQTRQLLDDTFFSPENLERLLSSAPGSGPSPG